MTEKFLTTFETAKVCQASPGSVVRWIREGKLPAAITAGGHHRIRLSDLLAFLRKLRMPIPLELEEPGNHRFLRVSSSPERLKQIQKILKRRFPDAVIEERL